MPRHLILITVILGMVLSLGALPVLAADSEGQAAGSQVEAFRTLQERLDSLEDELDLYKREANARKALMPTKEEASERRKTEEVLRATEEDTAEFVLLKSRTIEMRYSLAYSHSSYDRVATETADGLAYQYVDIERESYYSLINSIGVGYGLMDKVSLSASIPFIYKYQVSGEDQSISDLGDMSFGLSYQAKQETAKWPAILMSFGYVAPTGRSPYKIDPDNEMSTGDGAHSFSVGASFSKLLDPVIVFGAVTGGYSARVTGLDQKRSDGYTTVMVLEEVRPGHTISYAFGIGFSLSYTTSLTFRFNASHTSSAEFRLRSLYGYDARVYEGDDSSTASFSISTGWRLSPKTTLSVGLGYGLIGIESYSINASIPFEFSL
ncbi:SH3 type 3 domain-containing protein [Desulfatibacillum aliphaticivorans]|uniref:SH3 type 3 domain-containing protein n=1 Tax=Desulfatibacillum aliphaticivorans TaxID=218208 RepID=B8FF54_DESAL|nr:SH3 type 3 domain-containing protein [Desulfatibacillum aliphaticivorans]ACL03871.1 SH3 type 3 domain-containing protein [Desulfatibacillum aliphaticivorans]